jgi:gamma-glutamyltranspeptidase
VLGSAQSILIDGKNIYGAPDPRRNGSAIGY